MADLLKRLMSKSIAVDYIEKLLAAFSDPRFEARTQIQNPKSEIQNSLIEPLTNREIDILELLAERLQNKEIADKLFVSTETVKTHLVNIYQKLNVSNRRQAVEKAKILGILTIS